MSSLANLNGSNSDAPKSRDVDIGGFVWFCIAVLSAMVLFIPGIETLASAWSTPEYSHGPLIPLLSFYLFLRHLKRVPPQEEPIGDRLPGILVGFLGLALAMVGIVSRIPDIVTYGMIVWVFGLCLTGFGWSRGFQFWPSVLHLVFMLPLPAFLYWQVSVGLQTVSSEIGVWVIRQIGIPVFLDGNVIDLGIYKLQVAEACSGLRYLFPVMSFSYVFATLYTGSVWHKVVLLLSAAPITVLMNSFRIGMIGVLVDNYGISHAEGFLHYFEGWVIFLTCIIVLFGMARGMQFLSGDRRPLAEALDIDFSGLGPQIGRVLTIAPSRGMIILAVVTSALAIAWYATPERERVEPKRDPLVLFPRLAGDWISGPAQLLDPRIEEVLGADDYHSSRFSNPDQRAAVDLFIAYYKSQVEGEGIHSPEVCIPAGGWEMANIRERTVTMARRDGTSISFDVNRAIIRKGLNSQLVYYWFEQRGRRLTSDYMAKATTVVDAMLRGRTDGALIRLVTPVLPGEEPADADRRLQAFLNEGLTSLSRFVPE